MKKPDLIKQLTNRINQPHVIESWINKIEKAAYNKGYKDAESKQCNIPNVVLQSEQLCIKCKEAPANRGLGEHKLVCSDCWNSLCD